MKQLLNTRKTFLVNVLLGCTFRVQVIDVLMSKRFIDEVPSLSEDHLDKNLDQYVDDTISASQPRVLMTKWVGGACSKVGKMKDSIIRYFKKCGLSVALDGCENDEVNIEDLPEYQMPPAFVQGHEYVLDDEDEFEKEDEDKGNEERKR